MPTQWSEAEQAPLGCIAPYATAPLAPLRRGRCPRSGAKWNKYPWGASPRRAPRRDPPKPPFLPCHSEPVTDVTGVGIRLPPRRSAELSPPSVRWQHEALTEGEPFTHHLLALSFRASDRCHWRGNPRPQAPPPPHSNSFNFFSTKSSQNPLPAFKFFQVFSR